MSAVTDVVQDTVVLVSVCCPDCGWDDHGSLVLFDLWRYDAPPGPRHAMPYGGLALDGSCADEDGVPLACPACEAVLDPDTVVLACGQNGGSGDAA